LAYWLGSKYWRSFEERFSNGDNEIFAEASEDLGSIICDNDFESLSDCVGRQGIYNMVDMFIQAHTSKGGFPDPSGLFQQILDKSYWSKPEVGRWLALGLSFFGGELMSNLMSENYDSPQEALQWLLLGAHYRNYGGEI
jgi:hypothetical protein